MNREQITCILVGIFILAGMFLCVPVSIHMMSLYWYLGDPNAGMNMMTFYRFMPEGWPRVINYGVLFWQCFFLCVIISCIFFAFRRGIKNTTHDIKKWKKIILFVLMSASVLFFLLWFVEISLGNVFWYFKVGLLNAGLLGFLTTFITVNVYVDKNQSSRLLTAALISCSGLAYCMICSHWGYRYTPNEFKITPNIWRLSGVLSFLGVWVCYIIVQFIQQKKKGNR